MKKNHWLLLILMLTACFSLSAQSTKPRVLYVRVCEADGRSLSNDTSKLRFSASLFNVTRDETYYGFGYYHAGGNMYATIQLANFETEWYPGDVVKLEVTRQDTIFSRGFLEIVIPEGTETIWWGRPNTQGIDYPGLPVRLYPFMLHVDAPDPGIPILINGIPTYVVSCTPAFAKSKGDFTGVLSLAPPPTGWRWEPARHFVTLRDFEFSDSAYADADGITQPGWARTLEFRLVPEE
jgi:hypothetical protein